MTRIFIGGDTAGTGFGTVTADLGRALLALGADVRFVSMNEQPDSELSEPFKGRTLMTGGENGWLALPPTPRPPDEDATDEERAAFQVAAEAWAIHSDRLGRMFTGGGFEDGWSPEAVILIGDVASFKISPILQFLPLDLPTWHYVPIEGVGLPPRWTYLWQRMIPVAMSEFGATQIEALGIPRPPVVYHGVDTDVFHKIDAYRPAVMKTKTGMQVLKSKADCRRLLGMPQTKLILFRADRHMPRKNYPSLFRAVAPIMEKHANVDLLYHCRSIDQGGDLDDERSKYGPLVGMRPCVIGRHPEGHPMFGGLAGRMQPTGFHDDFGGVDRKMLNVLYNAADIYVSTSAEGFGLTIAEAMACGLPVVGMAYSSVPEVIGQGAMTTGNGPIWDGLGGKLVRPKALTDNIYSHFWALVDEAAFGTAVEQLVLSREARHAFGNRGPIHVAATFSWTRAAERFLDLIRTRLEPAPVEVARPKLELVTA